MSLRSAWLRCSCTRFSKRSKTSTERAPPCFSSSRTPTWRSSTATAPMSWKPDRSRFPGPRSRSRQTRGSRKRTWGSSPRGRQAAGLPLRKRYVLLRIHRADVFGPRPDQAIVLVLLHDMGGPAGTAREREDRREEVGGDAQHVVRRGRIKVHVAVETFLLVDDRLDSPRHVVPLADLRRFGEVSGHLAQVRGAGVLGRVNAAAKKKVMGFGHRVYTTED